MSNQLSVLLHQTIDRELPSLRALTDERASAAPGKPGAWTPKQELGHLLDSAANNHIRFAVAAIEGSYAGPAYAQDEWVKLHAWQELEWPVLVDFWHHHNRALAHLVAHISSDRMSAPCVVKSAPAVSLAFLIDDYILHMQHHLDHLLSREKITEYPRREAAV